MRSAQREIGFLVMVEFGLQPALFIVALVTSLAIAALVYIIELVAVDALARLGPLGLVALDQRLLATVVTGMTGNLPVLALEPETGQPLMVETALAPLLFTVTVLTAIAKAPAVHILDGMAGCAILRRILVAVPDMTEIAGHFLVCVSQLEIRLVMVKILL